MLTPLVAPLVAQAAPTSPESLLRHGKVAEALAAATAQAKARPDDVAAQELYVDLLLNLGMSGRARQEALLRVEQAPRSADAHYLVGRAELDANRARAAYEAALRLEPAHARAHMGMAAIHESGGDLAAARTAYLRAAREDGSLGEAWLGAVRVSLLAGDLSGATAAADQGLSACPSEPGLPLISAQLHQDRREAILRQGLTRVPDDPRLHEALGLVLLGKGSSSQALSEARAALALDPSSREALRLELVARELAEKRLDATTVARLEALRTAEGGGAWADWDALVRAAPRSALAMLGRGHASSDGLEDFLAAVDLDRANVEALAAAGLGLVKADRAAEAIPLLAAASDARPWDAALGLARWNALVETGQSRAAADFIARFATIHAFDPAVLAAHAGSLVDTGQVQEAYRVVRSGLMLVPDPRLAAAFVQIAPAAGHPEEAAALLDQIVAQTGNAALAEAARRLRGR